MAASSAFVVAPTRLTVTPKTALQMMDPSSFAQTITAPSMILAETEAWVQPAVAALDPFLNFMSFAMVSTEVCSLSFFELLVALLSWDDSIIFHSPLQLSSSL
jgi:hypothetical protein